MTEPAKFPACEIGLPSTARTRLWEIDRQLCEARRRVLAGADPVHELTVLHRFVFDLLTK